MPDRPPAWIRAVETGLIVLGLLFAFGIHANAIYSRHWNSDEPQHLHIVWAWTQGLLPYRDVFDNHTPLFSWLCSPLLRALGERADIVELMRWAMLPLFALSLWFTYRIGASLFSPRAGAWAAVLASLWPDWTGKMVEFRTDIFWTTVWLGVLAALLGGPLTRRRVFFAGLLLGAAFSTSMKSVLLLLTLLAASGAVLLFRYRTRTPGEPFPAAEVRRLAAKFLLGMLLLPAAWVCYFAAKGALEPLYYCVIAHNVVPKHENLGRHLIRTGWIVGLLAAIWLFPPGWMEWLVPERRRQTGALFLFALAIAFHPLVRGLWTKVTDQDYLPYWPIPVLVLAFAGASLAPRLLAERGIAFPLPTLALAVLVIRFAVALIPKHPETANRARVEQLAELLHLTRPGEYVMDAKGESIFRPRPYYYAIETFTRQRLQKGLLPEALPEALAWTHTAVVFGEMHLPASTHDFVAANYLPVSKGAKEKPFAVAGKVIGKAASVDVEIPQSYRVVGAGRVEGTIDGLPLTEAHWLEKGSHPLELTKSAGPVALVWSRAVEQGYTPF